MIGSNQRALEVAWRDAVGRVRCARDSAAQRSGGTARLRISVNAGLSEATIDRFVDTLSSILGTTSPVMPGSGVGRSM